MNQQWCSPFLCLFQRSPSDSKFFFTLRSGRSSLNNPKRRKSPVPPPSAPSSGGGGKLQPHQRHLHQAVSSSDLLAYQQQQQGSSSVPPFVEGGPNGQKHIFQENTYKKITPCDVCSQVLRGIPCLCMGLKGLRGSFSPMLLPWGDQSGT